MSADLLVLGVLTEDEEDALHDAIKSKLEGHRMVHMFEVEEDGSHGGAFHLIDRLSIDATDIAADISTGKEEIEAIVDAIFKGAKEYAMSIIAKRIHDRACICAKCLTEFADPAEVTEIEDLRAAMGLLKRSIGLLKRARHHLNEHGLEYGHPMQKDLIAEIDAVTQGWKP